MTKRLLSYDVPNDLVEKLQKKVLDELEELGFDSARKISYEASIPIAEILGIYPTEELVEAQKKGKEYDVSFQMKNLYYLEGQEKLGFIVVRLKPNEDFRKYRDWITENYNIKIYETGYVPHITLVSVDKKSFDSTDIKKLRVNPSGEIKPTKIQLWDTDKKILKEVVASEKIPDKKVQMIEDIISDLEKALG